MDLAATAGRTAADVVHEQLTAMPAATSVGEVRAWFAASGARRLALFTEGARYVGSIGRDELEVTVPDDAPAGDHAISGTTIAAGAPAAEARDLALAQESRRLPVVDEQGDLVGVVAIDEARTRFCGV